jgi:hypothetical protein
MRGEEGGLTSFIGMDAPDMALKMLPTMKTLSATINLNRTEMRISSERSNLSLE